jgi:hypothetical protein
MNRRIRNAARANEDYAEQLEYHLRGRLYRRIDTRPCKAAGQSLNGKSEQRQNFQTREKISLPNPGLKHHKNRTKISRKTYAASGEKIQEYRQCNDRVGDMAT